MTHHAPPGGVQTVHQTQVPGFGQSATGGQQVQNVAREYVVQGPSGLPSQQLHQGLHQSPQNQVIFDLLPRSVNRFSMPVDSIGFVSNGFKLLARVESSIDECTHRKYLNVKVITRKITRIVSDFHVMWNLVLQFNSIKFLD